MTRPPLAGPIEVGDDFVWAPTSQLAFAYVVVTDVQPNADGTWVKTIGRSGEYGNEERRFREACVRPAEVTDPAARERLRGDMAALAATGVEVRGVPLWLRLHRPDIEEWVREGERRYRGRLPATDLVDGWLFVAFDDHRQYEQVVEDWVLQTACFDLAQREFARMEHRLADDALPECVTSGCHEKGRTVFTAARAGRLAGRDWSPGDKVHLCPQHANDVYRTPGVVDAGFIMPDWLRLDARPGLAEVMNRAQLAPDVATANQMIRDAVDRETGNDGP